MQPRGGVVKRNGQSCLKLRLPLLELGCQILWIQFKAVTAAFGIAQAMFSELFQPTQARAFEGCFSLCTAYDVSMRSGVPACPSAIALTSSTVRCSLLDHRAVLRQCRDKCES